MISPVTSLDQAVQQVMQRARKTTPRQLPLVDLAKVVGGHARYGSGPDFNDSNDNSGNYTKK